MKKEDVLKRYQQKKTIFLSIRVTPEISRKLRQENISPTAIFYQGLKELGFVD